MSFENSTRDELIEQIVNLQTEKESLKTELNRYNDRLKSHTEFAAIQQEKHKTQIEADYFKGFWDGMFSARVVAFEDFTALLAVEGIENGS